MYKCDTCESVFDFPRIRTFGEVMDGDGNRERRKEIYCPDCGSPYFEEAEDI